MKIYNKRSIIVTLFLLCAPTIFGASVRGVIKKSPTVIIRNLAEASASIGRIINEFPQNAVVLPTYEKAQSDAILKSAKVLYDAARIQILHALSEIDSRIAYWQYQKDHPWNYFVSKNPMKWVTGPKQDDEIENNLDILKSHQGELYVLLGQLAECGLKFIQGYKDVFLTDYTKGYEWVDSLLDALVRITVKYQRTSDVPFLARLYQLQSKLGKVTEFKNDLLSDITETEIPSYLARNWFKGGLVLMGLNYGYRNFTFEQLQAPFISTGEMIKENVIEPVQVVIKDVFVGADKNDTLQDLVVSQQNVDVARNSVKKFLDTLSTEPGYLANPDITVENKQKILADINKGNTSSFQELGDELFSNNLKKIKGTEAKSLLIQLIAAQGTYQAQKKFEGIEKQLAGVLKIAFIAPAVLAAAGSYLTYQKMTKKNYGPLRRALVDINSLLVDPSQPLNDEQYGKMLYLIYMLKNRAMKELPAKRNMRADFIADLERIESPEYNVAAKRAIIEDMFKKYSFLGLIQKNSA